MCVCVSIGGEGRGVLNTVDTVHAVNWTPVCGWSFEAHPCPVIGSSSPGNPFKVKRD